MYTAYLIVQQYLIMGWGNLFPLFGWQPRWAPAPDAGDLGATRPASAILRFSVDRLRNP